MHNARNYSHYMYFYRYICTYISTINPTDYKDFTFVMNEIISIHRILSLSAKCSIQLIIYLIL